MTPAVFDLIIITVLLLSTLFAYIRGIIREIFTIIGLGASSLAAYKGGPLLVPQFNAWLDVPADGGEKAAEIVSRANPGDPVSNETVQAVQHKQDLIFGIASPGLVAKACAYGSAFILVFMIMVLAGFALNRIVKEMGFGIVDRLLGGAFGFARGFLFIFLLYVPCAFLIAPEKFPDWFKHSRSAPVLQKSFEYADTRFDMRKMIEDKGDGIAIKIGKVDPKEIGQALSKEEQELKQELTHEEMKAPTGGSGNTGETRP